MLDTTGSETNYDIIPETDTIIIEGRHFEWVVYRGLAPEGKLNGWKRSARSSQSVGATESVIVGEELWGTSSESSNINPEYIPLVLFTKDIRIELYIEGDTNLNCNYKDLVSGVIYP